MIEGNATYHFYFQALAQQLAANAFLTQSSGYTRLLYQPGRAEGGRDVAYPYVNQLYRTRLDVVLQVV